jgi:hypothetical protein
MIYFKPDINGCQPTLLYPAKRSFTSEAERKPSMLNIKEFTTTSTALQMIHTQKRKRNATIKYGEEEMSVTTQLDISN